MPDSVRYQTGLLRELVEDAEREAGLSSAEAEALRQRINEATSTREIATIWAQLDDDFQLLDEDQWTHRLLGYLWDESIIPWPVVLASLVAYTGLVRHVWSGHHDFSARTPGRSLSRTSL